MRGGKLLAEKNPTTLMEEHGTSLLADVVFKLSCSQIQQANNETSEICNESYTKFAENIKGNDEMKWQMEGNKEKEISVAATWRSEKGQLLNHYPGHGEGETLAKTVN